MRIFSLMGAYRLLAVNELVHLIMFILLQSINVVPEESDDFNCTFMFL
jgi:hypothetical protein